MRNELDERLKKTLGSLRPLDVKRFTNRVIERLREELGKEQQPSFLGRFFGRLIIFSRGFLGTVGSGRPAGAEQSGTFASRYATVFKVTAGLAAAVVVISTLIFVADYTSVEQRESWPISTRPNDTSPSYVLNERIEVRIEETRPCDILPPLLD